MRPDAEALHVLSATRAKAKMFEFRVPPGDHIELARSPSILFSLAVGILGDTAALMAEGLTGPIEVLSEKPLDAWDAGDMSLRDTSSEVMSFPATFFDAYLGSRLDQNLTEEFSLLCAASYYLANSPGSARVVIRNTPTPDPSAEGGLPNLTHSILDERYAAVDARYEYQETAELLRVALHRFFEVEGDAGNIVTACGALRKKAYSKGSPRQLLYADVVSALCRLKLSNASRTLLPAASGLNLESWRSALRKPHFPTELWPAQKLICDAGLLNGRSAVIQMPTSAGKTRATELIIRSAFLTGRTSLAVIVAPFRSLCHDIRSDLTNAFAGESIDLTEATDSYQPDLSFDELGQQKTVLILTPEKLLYLLRRKPDLSQTLGLVIYDEGHQFEGMARGPNYELLLTSLKIMLPASVQVILISAVIGNPQEVAGWLLNDPNLVVSGDGLLPTSKSVAFASWQTARGRLEYVSPEDPDEQEFFVPRVIERIALDNFPGETAERFFPRPKGSDVGLYLGLQLVPNGSVAVFCGRKDSAALLCERAVEIFQRNAPLAKPSESSDAPEVQKIAALFEHHLGAQANATRAAALGIFPHHANVPHGLRLSIEYAMKESLAKFVICTSTLAQGVNFPIKYLIVTTTQQGREQILIRDFHNLIGRAGRAGMHTEGSVIFSSPEVYDKRNSSTGRWRWQRTKELLDPSNSEPVKSSILSIFADYKQSQPPIVLEIKPEQLPRLAFADTEGIEAFVRRALKGNPQISARELRTFLNDRARAVQSLVIFLIAHVDFTDEDEAVSSKVAELAANTLAFHLAEQTTQRALIKLFQGIAESIQNRADDDLRSLIRKTPLPPASTASLRIWLQANLNSLIEASNEGALLDVIYGQIEAHLPSSYVDPFSGTDFLPSALRAWIEGRSIREIHEPFARARIRIGNHYAKIEDTVALCESGFGYDAALVVAALADLAEGLSDNLRANLALLQQKIKYGLNSPSAIGFFEAGFGDRIVAMDLADLFPNVQTRFQAKALVRREASAVGNAIARYPSYFTSVVNEIARA
jgi:superfamily II DNA/RNA helicase